MRAPLFRGYESVGRVGTEQDAARIYHARDVRTKAPVVIRVLPLGGHSPRQALLEEMSRFERLRYPGLVDLQQTLEQGRRLCLVTEFVRGPDLAQALARFEKIDPVRALRIGLGVCKGLQHLHERELYFGILRPVDVLTTCEFWAREQYNEVSKAAEPRPGVKLLTIHASSQLQKLLPEQDPAAIAQAGGSLATGGQERGATAGYVSPERYVGAPPTPQSDIFSLGVILYRAVSGRAPFGGGDFYAVKRAVARGLTRRLSEDVPFAFGDVIERCLRVNAEDRYESARELREHLEHLGVRANGRRTVYRLHRADVRHLTELRRARRIMLIAGTGIAIICAALAWVFLG